MADEARDLRRLAKRHRITFNPKCRARIWRSEIEACIKQPENDAGNLDERRKNRKPCTCPPKDRPQDFYEIGTNPLFDDRTQEVILHDPSLRAHLPKQEPDRVYGLQATNNFERLLSTALPSMTDDSELTLGDTIRSSPFKEGIAPLFFPFLILEAKSEKSSNGFNDIQTQTAFPILALLKLQEDLLAQVPDGNTTDGPLIWFFANRGDAWRVYGCCLSDSQTSGYDIYHLWNGSIESEDDSLQLLLIVDYIFDWARDIYRPSILRQLKSILTGSSFDQMTMTADSDIFSMRRNITNWIQAPPTVAGFELDYEFEEPNVLPGLDHQSLLPLPIPNTKLGTIRAAALIESRVESLYLNEQNIGELLGQGGKEPARQLLNWLSKWNELFLLTGGDLDVLEETWTGRPSVSDDSVVHLPDSKFYVLIEARTYMNISWTIVREISYVAVSEEAFETLVKVAYFRNEHPGKRLVPRIARPCSKRILVETIKCLASGSPRQHFLAATACTCLSLYSLPERKRDDYVPPTEALGLGKVKRARLLPFIQKISKIARKQEKPQFVIPREITKLSPHQQRLWMKINRPKRPVTPPRDLSFIRPSTTMSCASEFDQHEENLCRRCLAGHSYGKDQHYFSESGQVLSAYGLDLVVSINLTDETVDRNDICIFATDVLPELIDDGQLEVIVEDLLQSGYVYHTIRHPVPTIFADGSQNQRDIIWNVPLPYRPATEIETQDISAWVDELAGSPISTPIRHHRQGYQWDGLQVLLHFLRMGFAWADAHQEVKSRQDSNDSWPLTTPFFPNVFFNNQFRAKPKWPAPNTSLAGRTAIITGGNTGLGYETALQLLDLKLSHLIIAVRSLEKGESAAINLRKLHPEAGIEVWLLDMTIYDSIQRFASRVSGLSRIDIAILNAGVLPLNFTTVKGTGHETGLQVNYLSTVLLAILLLPMLKAKGPPGLPARLTIVNAALSLVAKFSNRNVNPLLPSFDNPKNFDRDEHYNTSKLLAHMFLWKLVDYVSADDVIVNLADPAWVKGTELARDVKGGMKIGLKLFNTLGRTPQVGASCFVDAVVNKGKESHGCFLMSWKIHPFAAMLYSPEGMELIDRVWGETMAELDFAGARNILDKMKV